MITNTVAIQCVKMGESLLNITAQVVAPTYTTKPLDKKQSKVMDTFVPTGLTYFTTPTTYQYVHLNSGIQFRSEEVNPEKAGAYWLSQLDYINEAKRKKTLTSVNSEFICLTKKPKLICIHN